MEDIFEMIINLKEDQYTDLRSKLIGKMYDLDYSLSDEQKLDGKTILSFRKGGNNPEIDVVIK